MRQFSQHHVNNLARTSFTLSHQFIRWSRHINGGIISLHEKQWIVDYSLSDIRQVNTIGEKREGPSTDP